MSLIEKADAFAEKHFVAIDQRRKFTNEPYMVHPRAVAEIVKSVTDDEVTTAVALLHDTVEDTDVTFDEIRAEFGDEVADELFWVTKVGAREHGNRKVRKGMDRDHYAKGTARSQTVKLADIQDNGKEVHILDPEFAKVYIPELLELAQVLTRGHPELRKRALKMLKSIPV